MNTNYWRMLGRDHAALDMAHEADEIGEWTLWWAWVGTFGFFPPDLAKTRRRDAMEEREAQICATWEDREDLMAEWDRN